MFGYTGTILRVNLTEGKVSREPLREEWARLYLGGRGLGARYLYSEIPVGVEPFDPENRLIFMVGPSTGTRLPTSGRYNIITKSPLTGLIVWANSGGHFGSELKYAGYDGVIVQGRASKPLYLIIDDDQAELRSAERLWGKPVRETEELVKEEAGGEDFRVASIGPAGENLVKFASVMNDSTRAAARGGVGAVMGGKGLKAVAVRGSGEVQVPDIEALAEFCDGPLRDVARYETIAISLADRGTSCVLAYMNAIGAFPTRNFTSGSFEDADRIDTESLKRIEIKRSGCFGCTLSCTRVTHTGWGRFGGVVGEGPEFETLNTLGGRCGVGSLDAIAHLNHLCNELGLDTISCGGAVSFAIECAEKGVLTREELGGLELRWGGVDAIIDLVKRISAREGLGKVLAEGVRRASAALGRGSERFAIHVKGMEMPAYEPRGLKPMALAYATSNRGACHLTSLFNITGAGSSLPIAWNIVLDPLMLEEEAVGLLKKEEELFAVQDSMGICKFIGMALTPEQLTQAVNLTTGWGLGVEEVLRLGERVWNLERAFNFREGGELAGADTLPDRFFQEPLPEDSGPAAGHLIPKEQFQSLLARYYQLRGWDEMGRPTVGGLRGLGMGDIAEDLEAQS